MKTLYLVRHSKPVKEPGLPTQNIPLCEEGIERAKTFFNKEEFNNIDKVYSSEYRRAIETAKFLCDDVNVIEGIHERVLGHPQGFKEADWALQFEDRDYKDEGGESFNEVATRVKEAINKVLKEIEDENKVVIVSHAIAICAYLSNYLEIKVVDSSTKSREFKYNNELIYSGSLATPCAFKIEFDEDKIIDIKYME